MVCTLKPLSIFFALLVGLTCQLHAQDTETERRARQFSTYYESLISQALGRYYHASSYMVDARVTLTEMVQALPSSQPQQAAGPNPPGEPPPGSAEQPSRNPDGLEALPGLPVLPEHMRTPGKKPLFKLDSIQTQSPAPNPNDRKQLGIKFVDITVLVDTVYNMQDVEFIMELVNMVAKLDDVRGDRVTVTKKVFPRVNRELDDHRLSTESSPHPVDTLGGQSRMTGWGAYWNELPALIPLLLILVFLTVIVFVVVRGLRQTSLPPELIKRLETARQPVVPAPDLAPAPKPVAAPSPEFEQKAIFETQRTICLNALIGDPIGGAMVLKNWIESDRSKGLSDAAVFVASLDPKVLEILRPHLANKDVHAIELQLDVHSLPELEERSAFLRTFHKDFRTMRTKPGDGSEISDIFGFLHQLSTPQLLHILKDEPVGIVGLALAQIPGERAGLILQQMDPDFRTQVLVAMGQIDSIPVQAYKEVATRLSHKALEVGNMRFVAADGVQTVLDIVQALGLAEQSEYLRSIAERDLNMASRLRRFYAQFDELPTLPEPLLVKVLETFDRDQLVNALVGTDVEYRERILAPMPQRMKLAIESGLQGKTDQSPVETERARKALLGLVRQELQVAGGRQ